MSRARLALLVTSALALAAPGCFVPLPEGPHTGIEGTEDTCHDHIDNNGNHMVDCRDPGCLEHGFCNQVIPLSVYISPEGRIPGTACWRHTRDAIVGSLTAAQLQAACESDPSGRCVYAPPVPPAGGAPTASPGDCAVRHLDGDAPEVLTTCNDRIDNDDDGHFDCGDPGCTGVFETCCNVEVTNELCRNLVDDDGNGFADCLENGCKHSQYDFVTACQTETWAGQPANCRNHLDDDRDHYVDCADRECLGDPLCVEDCTNGRDDNEDGRVDCLDPRCFGMPGLGGATCPMITENTDALCSDGLDNDGNEYVDCADRSCAMVTRCTLEHTRAACSDGLDNDDNGYADCADFSCTRTSSGALQEAVDYCNNFLALYGEADFARCTDGVDNDANGYADCADFSCINLHTPCQESYGDAVTNCTDHMDNDSDGFIDCEDWDCNYNPAMLVANPAGPAGATIQYCALQRAMLNPPQPQICGSY